MCYSTTQYVIAYLLIFSVIFCTVYSGALLVRKFKRIWYHGISVFNYEIGFDLDKFCWLHRYFLVNKTKEEIKLYGYVWYLDLYFLWFNIDILKRP